MREIPEYLYHKVLGGYTNPTDFAVEWAVDLIMDEGLSAVTATAWAALIPVEVLRSLPVVWLTENKSDRGSWLRISTKEIDKEKLVHIDAKDVNWWVYEGDIPVNAINKEIYHTALPMALPMATTTPSRQATFCANLHDDSMDEFNAKTDQEKEEIGNLSTWQIGWMLGRLESLLNTVPEQYIDTLIEDLASCRAVSKAKGRR